MPTFDEILDEATPDQRVLEVCFDRRLLSQLVEAQRKVEELEATRKLTGTGRDPEGLAEARDVVMAYEAQVAGKTRRLTFEGIGWGAWRELLAKHPPQDRQHEVFAEAVKLGFMPHSIMNIGYNAETFVPAAIAASCAEPHMTVAQAATLLRKGPAGVFERVWTAVLEVNLGGQDDPFVRASSNGSGAAIASEKR